MDSRNEDDGSLGYLAYCSHGGDRWDSLSLIKQMKWEVAALAVADFVRAESQWQPIETAPKDGQRILVVDSSGSVKLVCWCKDEYAAKPRPYWSSGSSLGILHDRSIRPTHWQPLPGAPK